MLPVVGGRGVSAILILLMAVAPWHLYWSQASRFYTQQFIFFSLCLVVYFHATQMRSRWRFLLAMVLMVLAFFTQPPALVIVAVFAGDWLLQWWHKQSVRLGWFGWASAIVALALCAGTLLIDILNRSDDWKFVKELYNSPVKVALGTIFMVGPIVAAFALMSGWWLLHERRRLAVYLLLGALLPTVVYVVASAYNYVGLRYTFVSLFCWLALAAVGVDALFTAVRPRLGRVLACAPIVLLLGSMAWANYGYYTSGVGFHARWREAFDYVAEHRLPNELVCTAKPIVGKYYMEDPSIIKLPKNPDELRAWGRSVWIVDETADAIRGTRSRPWEIEGTELKAYFDVRVVQPYSSVRVYRYDPQRDPST